MTTEREPYEKPSVTVLNLDAVLDEAVVILQDSVSKIHTLERRLETILADVEAISALRADAMLDVEKAEELITKVRTALEVKSGSEPATKDH